MKTTTENFLKNLAKACASDAYEENFSSRRGIYYIPEADIPMVCLYNSNPYADDPARRDSEVAVIRSWLEARDIRELAYATYPTEGPDMGYTTAMLIEADEDVIPEIAAVLADAVRSSDRSRATSAPPSLAGLRTARFREQSAHDHVGTTGAPRSTNN